MHLRGVTPDTPEPNMGSHKNNFTAKPTLRGDESQEGLSMFAVHSARRTDPTGALFPFPPKHSKTVAERRHETLRRFNRLRKHHSVTKAARIVGSSVPTLWRWQKKFTARGLAGLQPRNFKAGRRSPFARIRISAKAIRQLELLALEQCSPFAAWRHFANFSPECPPIVAQYVQRAGKPPQRFAALGRIKAVQARVFVSADERRLFVKLPCKGTMTARLPLPPKFKLVRRGMA
jgi:hypothetical protein